MKRIFLLVMIFAFVHSSQAQVQVSYYVVADADDVQLFMFDNMKTDLDAGNNKVVIITLTAGDEGYGNTTFNGSSMAYYLAKERGAVYSSKLLGDLTNSPIAPNNTRPLPTAQNVVINGKTMVKYYYGNVNGVGAVVNYFLRLPDGGSTGLGYPGTGNKSLKKFHDGTIPTIASVDGTATYNSWAELAYTIYSIIFTEKGLDLQVWLNASSLNLTVPGNPVYNPGDNSDHTYSSTAAQDGVATRLWVGIKEYVMDYSSNLAPNLNNEDFGFASGAFGVYNWSLIKAKYPNKVNSTTRAWLPAESSNIKRSPTGNAPLPITLVDFTGTLKGNNVLLEWTTSAEINSKEFQVEKSNDGVTYHKLYTVPAAGYSSVLKRYNYLDVEATELNYYRLKMVDLDGLVKQSNIVIVKNPGLPQEVSVLTNPFRDYINIRFSKLPKGETTLRLLDQSGRLINSSKIYNPLSSIIRFNTNRTLSNGIYILQADNEGKQYSVKLMKE